MKEEQQVKTSVRLGIIWLVLCVPLLSQSSTEQKLDRVTIQANRLSIIAANVQLSPQQSDVFWPLYHEYRGELLGVNDRLALLIREYAANFQIMTDEKAEALLDELIRIDKDRMKLRESYVKKFKKALPSKVVMRYFQVENKLDTIINYELAAEIPLVR